VSLSVDGHLGVTLEQEVQLVEWGVGTVCVHSFDSARGKLPGLDRDG